MDFDTEKDSLDLKEMVGKYETDGFLAQIATLLPLIGPPIRYKPFHVLDAPMKMLTYLGGLNIYANTIDRIPYTFDEQDWERIVMQMVKVKGGYFDKFMPPAGADNDGYYEFYRVSMPVFMDYFDTGPTNFEEQEIERITRIFGPFDLEIAQKYKLSVACFIEIYNAIDHLLSLNLNRYIVLLKDPECEAYWNQMRQLDVSPADWKYNGDNPNLIELVTIMKDMSERHKINIENLYHLGQERVSAFISLFLCNKSNDIQYSLYTDENILMAKPLYRLTDGRLLVLHDKQILTAIYNLLYNFCKSLGNNGDRLYKRRGTYLEDKTSEVLKDYFGRGAHIHTEYKIDSKAQERQDILILFKGLALIIEVKSGDRVEPHDKTISSYEKVYRNFKRNIQKGYDQAFRIKQLFDSKTDFDIYDNKGIFRYRVKVKNYHNVFSMIVTLDKFGPIQTDLTQILILEESDNYPLSICIDDLETLLLSMKKLKKGPGDLIRFLKWRQRLQGRLKMSDELSIWGTFLTSPQFSLVEDPNVHFQPGEAADEIFDELYIKGLGFANEKNIEKKKSDRWITFNPSHLSDYASGKKPFR